MSSKHDERRNDVNKKKKHKHKHHDNEKETIKLNRHKQSINVNDAETSPKLSVTLNVHKHTKPDDSNEAKIKNSKLIRKEKKNRKSEHGAEKVMSGFTTKSPVKEEMPLLLSTDDDSEIEDLKTIKKSVNDGRTTQVPKTNKVKQKIYSSSDEVEEMEVEAVPPPKKLEPTDNYFDGWSKEDIVQLISKMKAAIPKNDTLKYVSRVEKLNWEQISFGQHSPAECKEKWKVIEKKIRGYRILQEILGDAITWLEHPWTDFYRRGKKKNRHPDMPKKPLTSYMIFYMNKKEKITKENPGIGLTSLSKIIAEKFNKLSVKKKLKYNRLADAMRAKYQEDLRKFFQEHPNEMDKIKKNVGPVIVEPFLAKPDPPLKLFTDDKIKQHKDEKDFNQALLKQQCKEKWKTMSNKKKMLWIRWAYEKEMKYFEELKTYQAENPSFETPKYKSVLTKLEKKFLQRMEGKPEKPPGSAYGLFSKLMLNDPDLRAKYSTPKERMQEIAKLWKEAPKLEKDGYAEQLKHLLATYKLEYASYLESLPEDKREEEIASTLPKRKAKVDEPAKPKQKKIKTDVAVIRKKEDNKKTLIETLLAKEPKAPNGNSFDLFEEDMKLKNLGKKAKKAWEEASASIKQKYELKLEAMRQKYIVDYKSFLTNLKPEELKAYSDWKVKNKTQTAAEDEVSQTSEGSAPESEEGEEEDEQEQEEEEPELEVNWKAKKQDPSSSGSSSSSSSSSSSGSSSSSSSSSSEDEESEAF